MILAVTDDLGTERLGRGDPCSFSWWRSWGRVFRFAQRSRRKRIFISAAASLGGLLQFFLNFGNSTDATGRGDDFHGRL